MELKKMMENYKSTKDIAPIAEGICCSSMKGMLDCNDVDGNCSNCD